MVFTSAMAFFLILVLFIWLSVVSVLLWNSVRHYNTLTAGVSGKGMKQVLEAIVARQKKSKKQIQTLEESLALLQESCTFHIQRVGILRFNPFADTGGSQSFCMALLDGKDNGIVITSLHGRTGNRWYLKEVKSGKGAKVELSNEEVQAIKQAKERT